MKKDLRRDTDENDEELQKLHEEAVKKLRRLNIEGISIK